MPTIPFLSIAFLLLSLNWPPCQDELKSGALLRFFLVDQLQRVVLRKKLLVLLLEQNMPHFIFNFLWAVSKINIIVADSTFSLPPASKSVAEVLGRRI
jgi:hypothetical protein